MIQPLKEGRALSHEVMKEKKVPVDQQAFQSWQWAFRHFHFFLNLLSADYIYVLSKGDLLIVLSQSDGITVRF